VEVGCKGFTAQQLRHITSIIVKTNTVVYTLYATHSQNIWLRLIALRVQAQHIVHSIQG